MKAIVIFTMLSLLGISKLSAQQLGFESSSAETNSLGLQMDPSLLRALEPESAQPQSDAIVKKNVRVSGPLVRPFKAKKLSELPKRILHLINPFARSEPKEGLENVHDLNPQAWSSIVGWHPGGSAFPDAVTHEPTMNLISVSKENR